MSISAIVYTDHGILTTGVFFLLCLIAAYAGLSSLQLGVYVNDKVLHCLTFFVLTVVFYWIIDTNRRRTLNVTLIVCTLIGGVGSEFLQGFLPNGREFDFYDIVANVIGSFAGLGLCSWYHKRMLERKRQRKGYDAVAGEDEEELADLEAGEGPSGQEEGVMPATAAAAAAERSQTLEEEVDNWDENAVDAWDEGDDGDGDIGNIPSASKGKDADVGVANGLDGKKRAD
jgi:VanZ family protein